MTASSLNPEPTPRTGLSAPEGLQAPGVGTERHPTPLKGAQNATQSLGSEQDAPSGPQDGPQTPDADAETPEGPSGAQAGADGFDDTCRPVEVDGELIRVRGSGEMSDESQAALAEVIRAARRRMISEQRAAMAKYPYQDGDVTVLGPEIFVSPDGEVISWKGVNYVRQPRPDFTSPIAGRIEVRQPCPHCGDRQMIPRHQYAEHVARLHPDVHDNGPSIAECSDADRAHWDDKYDQPRP